MTRAAMLGYLGDPWCLLLTSLRYDRYRAGLKATQGVARTPDKLRNPQPCSTEAGMDVDDAQMVAIDKRPLARMANTPGEGCGDLTTGSTTWLATRAG